MYACIMFLPYKLYNVTLAGIILFLYVCCQMERLAECLSKEERRGYEVGLVLGS